MKNKSILNEEFIPKIQENIKFVFKAENNDKLIYAVFFDLKKNKKKQYLISEPVYQLIQIANNNNKTIKEITVTYNELFHKNFTTDDMIGIFESQIMPFIIIEQENSQKNPHLTGNLIIWNKNFITKLTNITKVLCIKQIVIPNLIFFIIGTVIILFHYPQVKIEWGNFKPGEVVLFYIVTLFIILFHEIGHASSAKYYGMESEHIGVKFRFIFFLFYVDLSDIWQLNKNKRIIINLGGVFFQVIVENILLILFLITHYSLIYYGMVINFFYIFFNLFPYFQFDGYWILSDFFNITNLNEKSLLIIKNRFFKNKKKIAKIDFFDYFNLKQKYFFYIYSVIHQILIIAVFLLSFVILRNIAINVLVITKTLIEYNSDIYSIIVTVSKMIINITIFLFLIFYQIKKIKYIIKL